jgi:hypothetical protein
VHIQALNPQTSCFSFSNFDFILHLLKIVFAFYLFDFILKRLNLDLSYFYFGLIVQLINLKGLGKIFRFKQRFSLLRSRAVIKGDAQDLGRQFMRNLMKFDYMTTEVKEFIRNDEAHTVINDETFDIPRGEFELMRYFVQRQEKRIVTYWAIDSSGIFYVLRT